MTTNGKSATRLRVIIGVVGVILVVGFIVGIGMKINTTLSVVIGRTDKSSSVALHFAEALRNQNYALAFGDLDSGATINGQVMDQSAFVKLATDADSERGVVLYYGLLADESDPTHFNVKLQRGSQSYLIHVWLQPSGTVWKIGSIDTL